jgi:hypothetical protein
VAQFVKVLEEQGALDYSIVIAATASDPAPMQFSGTGWRRPNELDTTIVAKKLLKDVSKLDVRRSAHRATSWPLQIELVEASGEPAVDRSEKIVGWLPLAPRRIIGRANSRRLATPCG